MPGRFLITEQTFLLQPCHIQRTLAVAVQVVDLAPFVLPDDADECACVQRAHIELVVVLLSRCIDGHARRDERHPEGARVRLDGVDAARPVRAKQRDDTAGHEAADCKRTAERGNCHIQDSGTVCFWRGWDYLGLSAMIKHGRCFVRFTLDAVRVCCKLQWDLLWRAFVRLSSYKHKYATFRCIL